MCDTIIQDADDATYKPSGTDRRQRGQGNCPKCQYCANEDDANHSQTSSMTSLAMSEIRSEASSVTSLILDIVKYNVNVNYGSESNGLDSVGEDDSVGDDKKSSENTSGIAEPHFTTDIASSDTTLSDEDSQHGIRNFEFHQFSSEGLSDASSSGEKSEVFLRKSDEYDDAFTEAGGAHAVSPELSLRLRCVRKKHGCCRKMEHLKKHHTDWHTTCRHSYCVKRTRAHLNVSDDSMELRSLYKRKRGSLEDVPLGDFGVQSGHWLPSPVNKKNYDQDLKSKSMPCFVLPDNLIFLSDKPGTKKVLFPISSASSFSRSMRHGKSANLSELQKRRLALLDSLTLIDQHTVSLKDFKNYLAIAFPGESDQGAAAVSDSKKCGGVTQRKFSLYSNHFTNRHDRRTVRGEEQEVSDCGQTRYAARHLSHECVRRLGSVISNSADHIFMKTKRSNTSDRYKAATEELPEISDTDSTCTSARSNDDADHTLVFPVDPRRGNPDHNLYTFIGDPILTSSAIDICTPLVSESRESFCIGELVLEQAILARAFEVEFQQNGDSFCQHTSCSHLNTVTEKNKILGIKDEGRRSSTTHMTKGFVICEAECSAMSQEKDHESTEKKSASKSNPDLCDLEVDDNEELVLGICHRHLPQHYEHFSESKPSLLEVQAGILMSSEDQPRTHESDKNSDQLLSSASLREETRFDCHGIQAEENSARNVQQTYDRNRFEKHTSVNGALQTAQRDTADLSEIRFDGPCQQVFQMMLQDVLPGTERLSAFISKVDLPKEQKISVLEIPQSNEEKSPDTQVILSEFLQGKEQSSLNVYRDLNIVLLSDHLQESSSTVLSQLMQLDCHYPQKESELQAPRSQDQADSSVAPETLQNRDQNAECHQASLSRISQTIGQHNTDERRGQSLREHTMHQEDNHAAESEAPDDYLSQNQVLTANMFHPGYGTKEDPSRSEAFQTGDQQPKGSSSLSDIVLLMADQCWQHGFTFVPQDDCKEQTDQDGKLKEYVFFSEVLQTTARQVSALPPNLLHMDEQHRPPASAVIDIGDQQTHTEIPEGTQAGDECLDSQVPPEDKHYSQEDQNEIPAVSQHGENHHHDQTSDPDVLQYEQERLKENQTLVPRVISADSLSHKSSQASCSKVSQYEEECPQENQSLLPEILPASSLCKLENQISVAEIGQTDEYRPTEELLLIGATTISDSRHQDVSLVTDILCPPHQMSESGEGHTEEQRPTEDHLLAAGVMTGSEHHQAMCLAQEVLRSQDVCLGPDVLCPQDMFSALEKLRPIQDAVSLELNTYSDEFISQDDPDHNPEIWPAGEQKPWKYPVLKTAFLDTFAFRCAQDVMQNTVDDFSSEMSLAENETNTGMPAVFRTDALSMCDRQQSPEDQDLVSEVLHCNEQHLHKDQMECPGTLQPKEMNPQHIQMDKTKFSKTLQPKEIMHPQFDQDMVTDFLQVTENYSQQVQVNSVLHISEKQVQEQTLITHGLPNGDKNHDQTCEKPSQENQTQLQALQRNEQYIKEDRALQCDPFEHAEDQALATESLQVKNYSQQYQLHGVLQIEEKQLQEQTLIPQDLPNGDENYDQTCQKPSQKNRNQLQALQRNEQGTQEDPALYCDKFEHSEDQTLVALIDSTTHYDHISWSDEEQQKRENRDTYSDKEHMASLELVQERSKTVENVQAGNQVLVSKVLHSDEHYSQRNLLKTDGKRLHVYQALVPEVSETDGQHSQDHSVMLEVLQSGDQEDTQRYQTLLQKTFDSDNKCPQTNNTNVQTGHLSPQISISELLKIDGPQIQDACLVPEVLMLSDRHPPDYICAVSDDSIKESQSAQEHRTPVSYALHVSDMYSFEDKTDLPVLLQSRLSSGEHKNPESEAVYWSELETVFQTVELEPIYSISGVEGGSSCKTAESMAMLQSNSLDSNGVFRGVLEIEHNTMSERKNDNPLQEPFSVKLEDDQSSPRPITDMVGIVALMETLDDEEGSPALFDDADPLQSTSTQSSNSLDWDWMDHSGKGYPVANGLSIQSDIYLPASSSYVLPWLSASDCGTSSCVVSEGQVADKLHWSEKTQVVNPDSILAEFDFYGSEDFASSCGGISSVEDLIRFSSTSSDVTLHEISSGGTHDSFTDFDFKTRKPKKLVNSYESVALSDKDLTDLESDSGFNLNSRPRIGADDLSHIEEKAQTHLRNQAVEDQIGVSTDTLKQSNSQACFDMHDKGEQIELSGIIGKFASLRISAQRSEEKLMHNVWHVCDQDQVSSNVCMHIPNSSAETVCLGKPGHGDDLNIEKESTTPSMVGIHATSTKRTQIYVSPTFLSEKEKQASLTPQSIACEVSGQLIHASDTLTFEKENVGDCLEETRIKVQEMLDTGSAAEVYICGGSIVVRRGRRHKMEKRPTASPLANVAIVLQSNEPLPNQPRAGLDVHKRNTATEAYISDSDDKNDVHHNTLPLLGLGGTGSQSTSRPLPLEHLHNSGADADVNQRPENGADIESESFEAQTMQTTDKPPEGVPDMGEEDDAVDDDSVLSSGSSAESLAAAQHCVTLIVHNAINIVDRLNVRTFERVPSALNSVLSARFMNNFNFGPRAGVAAPCVAGPPFSAREVIRTPGKIHADLISSIPSGTCRLLNEAPPATSVWPRRSSDPHGLLIQSQSNCPLLTSFLTSSDYTKLKVTENRSCEIVGQGASTRDFHGRMKPPANVMPSLTESAKAETFGSLHERHVFQGSIYGLTNKSGPVAKIFRHCQQPTLQAVATCSHSDDGPSPVQFSGSTQPVLQQQCADFSYDQMTNVLEWTDIGEAEREVITTKEEHIPVVEDADKEISTISQQEQEDREFEDIFLENCATLPFSGDLDSEMDRQSWSQSLHFEEEFEQGLDSDNDTRTMPDVQTEATYQEAWTDGELYESEYPGEDSWLTMSGLFELTSEVCPDAQRIRLSERLNDNYVNCERIHVITPECGSLTDLADSTNETVESVSLQRQIQVVNQTKDVEVTLTDSVSEDEVHDKAQLESFGQWTEQCPASFEESFETGLRKTCINPAEDTVRDSIQTSVAIGVSSDCFLSLGHQSIFGQSDVTTCKVNGTRVSLGSVQNIPLVEANNTAESSKTDKKICFPLQTEPCQKPQASSADWLSKFQSDHEVLSSKSEPLIPLDRKHSLCIFNAYSELLRTDVSQHDLTDKGVSAAYLRVFHSLILKQRHSKTGLSAFKETNASSDSSLNHLDGCPKSPCATCDHHHQEGVMMPLEHTFSQLLETVMAIANCTDQVFERRPDGNKCSQSSSPEVEILPGGQSIEQFNTATVVNESNSSTLISGDGSCKSDLANSSCSKSSNQTGKQRQICNPLVPVATSTEHRTGLVVDHALEPSDKPSCSSSVCSHNLEASSIPTGTLPECLKVSHPHAVPTQAVSSLFDEGHELEKDTSASCKQLRKPDLHVRFALMDTGEPNLLDPGPSTSCYRSRSSRGLHCLERFPRAECLEDESEEETSTNQEDPDLSDFVTYEQLFLEEEEKEYLFNSVLLSDAPDESESYGSTSGYQSPGTTGCTPSPPVRRHMESIPEEDENTDDEGASDSATWHPSTFSSNASFSSLIDRVLHKTYSKSRSSISDISVEYRREDTLAAEFSGVVMPDPSFSDTGLTFYGEYANSVLKDCARAENPAQSTLETESTSVRRNIDSLYCISEAGAFSPSFKQKSYFSLGEFEGDDRSYCILKRSGSPDTPAKEGASPPLIHVQEQNTSSSSNSETNPACCHIPKVDVSLLTALEGNSTLRIPSPLIHPARFHPPRSTLEEESLFGVSDKSASYLNILEEDDCSVFTLRDASTQSDVSLSNVSSLTRLLVDISLPLSNKGDATSVISERNTFSQRLSATETSTSVTLEGVFPTLHVSEESISPSMSKKDFSPLIIFDDDISPLTISKKLGSPLSMSERDVSPQNVSGRDASRLNLLETGASSLFVSESDASPVLTSKNIASLNDASPKRVAIPLSETLRVLEASSVERNASPLSTLKRNTSPFGAPEVNASEVSILQDVLEVSVTTDDPHKISSPEYFTPERFQGYLTSISAVPFHRHDSYACNAGKDLSADDPASDSQIFPDDILPVLHGHHDRNVHVPSEQRVLLDEVLEILNDNSRDMHSASCSITTSPPPNPHTVTALDEVLLKNIHLFVHESPTHNASTLNIRVNNIPVLDRLVLAATGTVNSTGGCMNEGVNVPPRRPVPTPRSSKRAGKTSPPPTVQAASETNAPWRSCEDRELTPSHQLYRSSIGAKLREYLAFEEIGLAYLFPNPITNICSK